jgi:hypothetical protein
MEFIPINLIQQQIINIIKIMVAII